MPKLRRQVRSLSLSPSLAPPLVASFYHSPTFSACNFFWFHRKSLKATAKLPCLSLSSPSPPPPSLAPSCTVPLCLCLPLANRP
jgi:hypothetical protein